MEYELSHRHNHFERAGENSDLDRSIADVLAIGIKRERTAGFQAEPPSTEAFDLFEPDVCAKKDGRQDRQKFELVHPPDQADVEHAVIELRLRRDLDAFAITVRIACGNQQAGTADVKIITGDANISALEGRRGVQCGNQISNRAAQPGRHAVGARVSFRVQASSGDAAEEGFLPIFADYSQIDFSDVVAMRTKMLPGRKRDAFVPDAERLGKVVATAFGDDQRGNFVLEELR